MHNLSCLSSGKKLKTSCCFCLCASQKGGAAVVVGHTTLRLRTDFMGCFYQQMEKKALKSSAQLPPQPKGKEKKKVQWVKVSLSLCWSPCPSNPNQTNQDFFLNLPEGLFHALAYAERLEKSAKLIKKREQMGRVYTLSLERRKRVFQGRGLCTKWQGFFASISNAHRDVWTSFQDRWPLNLPVSPCMLQLAKMLCTEH